MSQRKPVHSFDSQHSSAIVMIGIDKQLITIWSCQFNVLSKCARNLHRDCGMSLSLEKLRAMSLFRIANSASRRYREKVVRNCELHVFETTMRALHLRILKHLTNILDSSSSHPFEQTVFLIVFELCCHATLMVLGPFGFRTVLLLKCF
jgi:hypothetical protein